MGIVVYFVTYIFDRAGISVVTRLRRQLFNKLMDLEIGFYDSKKTGELVNRLSADTNTIKVKCFFKKTLLTENQQQKF